MILLLFLCFGFFVPKAYGILALRPGVEPPLCYTERQSLDPWTAGKSLCFIPLKFFIKKTYLLIFKSGAEHISHIII